MPMPLPQPTKKQITAIIDACFDRLEYYFLNWNEKNAVLVKRMCAFILKMTEYRNEL